MSEKTIHRDTNEEIKRRRLLVQGYLQKSMRSPTAIASQLNSKWPRHVIARDIRYIMKGAWEWVDDQAMYGFISDVKLAVEELQNLEIQLQDIIQSKESPSIKLRAIQTKVDCINSRLNLQGKGPILMRLKRARSIIEKQRREGYKARASGTS